MLPTQPGITQAPVTSKAKAPAKKAGAKKAVTARQAKLIAKFTGAKPTAKNPDPDKDGDNDLLDSSEKGE